MSKTTRIGLRRRGRVAHGEARIVGERGADADRDRVVRARSSCTLARASGPVTHFEAPVRVAMRPSSESASLSET